VWMVKWITVKICPQRARVSMDSSAEELRMLGMVMGAGKAKIRPDCLRVLGPVQLPVATISQGQGYNKTANAS
jgi:hypothetical protein